MANQETFVCLYNYQYKELKTYAIILNLINSKSVDLNQRLKQL